jgi:hypothetical protein
MVFLESKRDYTDIQFVLLDLKSREVKKIHLTGESLGEYSDWTIFGADEDEGRRYWLMYPSGMREYKPICQLWEDGQIDTIGTSQSLPCYINRTLLSYAENEIIISKLREGELETIQRIPNMDDLHFGWYLHYQRKLTNSPVNEIYGRKVYRPLKDENEGWIYVAKYARLDLENFEIEEMADLKGSLAFHAPGTDSFCALEMDKTNHEVKLYKVKKGRLELLKTFEDMDSMYGLDDVEISNSGILVKSGKKIKVYAWPDLKEIKFKKL